MKIRAGGKCESAPPPEPTGRSSDPERVADRGARCDPFRVESFIRARPGAALTGVRCGPRLLTQSPSGIIHVCRIIARMATRISEAQTTPRPAEAAAGELVSFDPATGEELGRVPLGTSEAVARAVGRARGAQKGWAALSFRERGAVVLRARSLLLEGMEELAALISREAGKPEAEALSMEIVPTLDLMQFFARRAGRLLRPERIDIGLYRYLGRSSKVVYRPLGVVGIISPWNFPWAIPLGE